jgi:hypothetical protein
MLAALPETTMSILNQIANNEITKLELQDEAEIVFENDDGSIYEFLDALKKNTSIASMVLRGDFLSCLRADARDQVLKAISGNHIQHVIIGDTLLLVQDLTQLVGHLKSLRSLELHNLVLQGQEDHFQAFEAALLQHPSLKEFDMSDNCETAIKGIELSTLRNAKKSGCCTKMPYPATSNSAIAKSA